MRYRLGTLRLYKKISNHRLHVTNTVWGAEILKVGINRWLGYRDHFFHVDRIHCFDDISSAFI